MSEKSSPLRETDEAAISLAKSLLRDASFAALAVNEPETGFPLASRVLVATDTDGTPVILISALSNHTRAILQDSKVSLLTGEPGKGDPMAHPRMTTRCLAAVIERGGDDHQRVRTRFLDRHPKARTYIDFPDFNLFRLSPVSANLNGGFGKAYAIEGKALIEPD